MHGYSRVAHRVADMTRFVILKQRDVVAGLIDGTIVLRTRQRSRWVGRREFWIIAHGHIHAPGQQQYRNPDKYSHCRCHDINT